MKKWMLTSPFTGETHAVTAEEARRLLCRPEGSAGTLADELRLAEASAAAEGRDRPVHSGDGSEEWAVSAPSRRD